jgi:hypothetical protein
MAYAAPCSSPIVEGLCAHCQRFWRRGWGSRLDGMNAWATSDCRSDGRGCVEGRRQSLLARPGLEGLRARRSGLAHPTTLSARPDDDLPGLGNLRAYPRSATLEISKGGQTLLTRPMVETVACCPEGRLFTLSVTFKQKAFLGRLTARMTVTMAGSSGSAPGLLIVKQLKCKAGHVVKAGRCVKHS